MHSNRIAVPSGQLLFDSRNSFNAESGADLEFCIDDLLFVSGHPDGRTLANTRRGSLSDEAIRRFSVER
jgi:hypothetical protein